ncbi:MAG: metal ABC transporter permease [Opitutus sp.]|nr:metal ABC transporter permease [Opitutus sp.]MCS6248707.1 metal ABC transporter permease [Opitutus sp.]MCS6274216.1 metal ABC transporter permease [Opitutus sp.]MCS6277117.1 metal ABC transporter permease [Opitutus sp.]MCS6300239.1 metal ABC transporter permease [Opitutus sp.]
MNAQLLDTLLEPFAFGFMRQAFALGALVATVSAVLSCFLVLRGWSLMGDAISHAVLPGIVLAYIAGVPLAVGAFGSGLFCAVATGWVKRNSRIKEDTVMGVVFTGMFAFGLVLFSKTPSDLHLDHILFGNILGITPAQIWETSVLSVIVLGVILILRRDLMLVCFDPSHAKVLGLRVQLLTYLLLVLLSLAIVAAMKAVGLMLVIAMLITPGATALLLTKRFDRMLQVAVLIAVGSSTTGIYISFFADASPAACIVLVQALVFVATLCTRHLRRDAGTVRTPE